MSAPQPAESPPKLEVKQRPPLPSKSINGTSDSPPTGRVTPGRISGNIQKIVSKFNQPAAPSSSSDAAGSRGSKRRAKRAPTVKPRPRVTFSPKSMADQAPPLPVKQRLTLKKETEQEERNDAAAVGGRPEDAVIPVVTDNSRSAPDGGEVEVQNAGPRPEQTPSSLSEPQCARECGCVCHLHRPGMKLVWVPIVQEELEAGKKEARQDCEAELRPEEDHKGRTGEEESESSDPEDNEELVSSSSEEENCEEKDPLPNKTKFQEVRNVIEEQLRRTSDPGPEVTLTSFNPLPPGTTSPTKAQSISEEESIYEATLDVLVPSRDPCEITLQVPVIPPLCPPKGAAARSPPTIPPRMPVEKARTPRFPRSSAQLQVPLVPKVSPADNSPPSSPKPQRSALLLPARANGRRLSGQSSMSTDEVEGSSAGDGEKQEKKPSAALTRQKSLDMEAHMPEEFLYQMYTESYITKEIRRQTLCRNISKTSVDFQMEHPRMMFSSGTGTGGPRSSPVPSLKQSTLWQDLPAVRESGILQTLTPEECKYQESIFEVLTSEISYLRSLRVLTEHFMDSRELNDTLVNRDKKPLFSNIVRIQEVSEKFLKDLEVRQDESLLITDICDIINYHAQHNFPAYIDYVRNQIYQEKTYSALMQSNTQFSTVIARLQENPKCQRLPFMSFLLLPFQRITRIKILIENILKRTAVGTKEEESASKALASVSKIIAECNTQVGKMKQMEELIEINKMLEFDKLKAVPIISQNRFLEKRGELQEMAKGGTLFHLKPKCSPVYLFLFNDLLIIAVKKGADRYVVLDHAHRSLVQVQEQTMREDSANLSLENCFSLTLLENHQGRMIDRFLKAPSQSDMQRWLAAFPNPDDPHGEQDEVIYEDWDCPQVQCVKQYVAKQTDELNLDPPEIINVVRKANEGWYQGIRMSDGQKGWFPIANVLEITNEHVRRRNLRERYRVIQAASAVTNKLRTLT